MNRAINLPLIILLIIGFYLSTVKAFNTTDIHHWSIMAYGVERFYQLKAYSELYTQYGMLTGALIGPAVYLGLNSKIAIGLFYAIIFSAIVLAIYKVTYKYSNKVYALIAAITFLIIYPRIQYPWPDYGVSLCILGIILFKNHKYIVIVLTILAIFFREVAIVYFTLILLVNYIIFKITNKRTKLLKEVFIGIIIHYIFLIIYLIYSNGYEEYLMQTFNLSFWKFQNESIPIRVFTRIYGLSKGANFEIKALGIITIILGIFNYIYISIKKLSNNDDLILINTLGMCGFIMTIHIPDLYRIQIYCFPVIIATLLILNQVNIKLIFKILLYIVIIFFIIFSQIKNKYKDASQEGIDILINKNETFNSYKLSREVISFYSNIMQSSKGMVVINKTPDPILDIIIHNGKYTSSLPFYSEDFISRIKVNEKKYDFYLTFTKDKNCTSLGKMPERVSFITGTEYFICKK